MWAHGSLAHTALFLSALMPPPQLLRALSKPEESTGAVVTAGPPRRQRRTPASPEWAALHLLRGR